MSLLSSILQYLPGLVGSAIGGFQEGLVSTPSSLAGTPTPLAGGNDRGPSGGDMTWDELRRAGLSGGGASNQPAYVRQMGSYFPGETAAVREPVSARTAVDGRDDHRPLFIFFSAMCYTSSMWHVCHLEQTRGGRSCQTTQSIHA